MAKTHSKPGPKPPVLGPIVQEGMLLGRNKVPVTAKEVYNLASVSCTVKCIAAKLGVPWDSLKRHFADEIINGHEDAKISLRQAMMHNACVNHNAAVQIFLAKNLLGMSDAGMVDDDTDESDKVPFTGFKISFPPTTKLDDDDDTTCASKEE